MTGTDRERQLLTMVAEILRQTADVLVWTDGLIEQRWQQKEAAEGAAARAERRALGVPPEVEPFAPSTPSAAPEWHS